MGKVKKKKRKTRMIYHPTIPMVTRSKNLKNRALMIVTAQYGKRFLMLVKNASTKKRF
jgi:hypothetical protein